VAAVQAHGVVEGLLALLLLLIPRVGQPPVALQQHGGAEVLLAVPPVAGARRRAARAQDALVQAVQLPAVLLALQVLLAVGRRGGVLQVRLDGLVLLVEVGQVGHDVLDDVGVRERVDLGFLLGVGGDSACISGNAISIQLQTSDERHAGTVAGGEGYIHKQARVLTPSMFIAQLPQMPSLQLRRKVRVGSTSFLMRISASSIIGPVLFRSSVYACMCGFVEGSSGFQR
jgi:hypothetical protein